MGNNECCHAKQEKDYSSQVLQLNQEALQIHPKEHSTPVIQKHQKQERPQESEPDPITIEVVDEKPIEIPTLAPIIKQRVDSQKFFESEMKGELKVRRYGKEIYQGQLEQSTQIPHGLGRMFKADGSLYIGHFEQGKAEGQGVFLSPDGLVYQGHFHNNHAQGLGKYEAAGLTYEGHFLNNRFHGHGKEVSKDYSFEGEYYEGQKTHGVFKWVDQKGGEYIYTGHFNFKNQFHGEGILGEPVGTYAGEFKDGLKHGRGIYRYHTGLRYEGEYQGGVKKGKGVIYNFNNTIAYEGEFDHDMPHGQGCIYDGDRSRHSTTWIEGIDSAYL